MKPEQQVTSVKVSTELLALGIKKKSQKGWKIWHREKIYHAELRDYSIMSGMLRAYSLSELGEMIPFGSFSANPVAKIHNGMWVLRSEPKAGAWDTQVDAMGWYLYKLVKTGEVSIDQINGIIVKSKLVASGQETPDPTGDNLSNRTIIES